MSDRVASALRAALPAIPLLLSCVQLYAIAAAPHGPVVAITHHEQPKFVDVVFSLGRRSTALGMPVHVVITVTNRSGGRLYVGEMGLPCHPLRFTPAHRRDRGVVVFAKPAEPHDGPSQGDEIGPRRRLQKRVLLNRWLIFDRPGAYEILASAEIDVTVRPRTQVMFVDAHRFAAQHRLTVQVTPRDPRRLEAVAEEYSRQLRDPDRRTRQQAWEELSFLCDPAFERAKETACQSQYGDIRARAIPHFEDRLELEGLLATLDDSKWHVVARALTALGRLGDPSAIKPLCRAMSHGHPLVRKAAMAALVQLSPSEASRRLGQRAW